MDYDEARFYVLVICCVVGFAFMSFILYESSESREQAVKKGFAQHNATTGDWEWKEKGK